MVAEKSTQKSKMSQMNQFSIPLNGQFFVHPKLFLIFNLILWTVLTILMVFFSGWKFLWKYSVNISDFQDPKKIRLVNVSVERNVQCLLSGKCPRYSQVLYRQFYKVLGFPTVILCYWVLHNSALTFLICFDMSYCNCKAVKAGLELWAFSSTCQEVFVFFF